jgi:hypothetical protein
LGSLIISRIYDPAIKRPNNRAKGISIDVFIPDRGSKNLSNCEKLRFLGNKYRKGIFLLIGGAGSSGSIQRMAFQGKIIPLWMIKTFHLEGSLTDG